MKGAIACQQIGGHAQVPGVARRGTRVIWRKLDCLIAQSPEDRTVGPPERHPRPAPRSATGSNRTRRNLRGVERCPMRAIKETNGTPTSRSDVRQGRTRDRLRGASPMATEGPVVVGSSAPPRRAGDPSTGRRSPGDRTLDGREVCVMQIAAAVRGVLRASCTGWPLESPVIGNGHAVVREGGRWKRALMGTSPASLPHRARGTTRAESQGRPERQPRARSASSKTACPTAFSATRTPYPR